MCPYYHLQKTMRQTPTQGRRRNIMSFPSRKLNPKSLFKKITDYHGQNAAKSTQRPRIHEETRRRARKWSSRFATNGQGRRPKKEFSEHVSDISAHLLLFSLDSKQRRMIGDGIGKKGRPSEVDESREWLVVGYESKSVGCKAMEAAQLYQGEN